MLNTHIWLQATILDRTIPEHFQHRIVSASGLRNRVTDQRRMEKQWQTEEEGSSVETGKKAGEKAKPKSQGKE